MNVESMFVTDFKSAFCEPAFPRLRYSVRGQLDMLPITTANACVYMSAMRFCSHFASKTLHERDEFLHLGFVFEMHGFPLGQAIANFFSTVGAMVVAGMVMIVTCVIMSRVASAVVIVTGMVLSVTV